jgi:hypothetical protein
MSWFLQKAIFDLLGNHIAPLTGQGQQLSAPSTR